MFADSFPRAIRKLVRTVRRLTPCEDTWEHLGYRFVRTEDVPLGRLECLYKMMCGPKVNGVFLAFYEVGRSLSNGVHGHALISLFNLYSEFKDEPLLKIGILADPTLEGYSCTLALQRPEEKLLDEMSEKADLCIEYLEREARTWVPFDRWRPALLHDKLSRAGLPVCGVSPDALKDQEPNSGCYIIRENMFWRIDWPENPNDEQREIAERVFEEYYDEITNTLVVLHVSSNPLLEENDDQLKTDAEVRDLQKLFRHTAIPARIETLIAATPTWFEAEFIRSNPTILHFSMHASPDRGLILEDNTYAELPYSAAELESFLKSKPFDLKLLFLNCCHGKEIAEQLNIGVPIIAAEGPLSDELGRKFAVAFYRRLLNGHSFEVSLNDAKREIAELEAEHVKYHYVVQPSK